MQGSMKFKMNLYSHALDYTPDADYGDIAGRLRNSYFHFSIDGLTTKLTEFYKTANDKRKSKNDSIAPISDERIEIFLD